MARTTSFLGGSSISLLATSESICETKQGLPVDTLVDKIIQSPRSMDALHGARVSSGPFCPFEQGLVGGRSEPKLTVDLPLPGVFGDRIWFAGGAAQLPARQGLSLKTNPNGALQNHTHTHTE